MLAEDTTVLIIDDDEDIGTMAAAFLRQCGFQCDVARSAAEGLAKARASVPRVILCDSVMPPTSGSEFIAALRQHPETANVPVVLMSGYSETSVDMTGSVGFLQKPFQAGELVATVRQALASQK